MKNEIDCLILTSPGSRTVPKSTKSELGAISTKFNSKPTHGLSNSVRKLRNTSSESNGGFSKTQISQHSEQADDTQYNTGGLDVPATVDASKQSIPFKSEEVTISDLQAQLSSGLVVLPPERPPKPAHLTLGNANNSELINNVKPAHCSHSSENYANAADMQELYLNEQNNNINCEPSQPCQTFDIPTQTLTGNLKNNSDSNAESALLEDTHVPSTDLGSGVNLFQKFEPHHAPMISRELKPNRKNLNARNRSQTIGCNMIASYMTSFDSNGDTRSDKYEGSQSNVFVANTNSHNFATLGPPVVRELKPKNFDAIEGRSRFNSVDFAALSTRDQIIDPYNNSRRNSAEDEQIYYYMPPVNTTSGLGSVHSTHPPHLMIPAASFEHPSISYIDLDLPRTTSPTTKNNSINGQNFETKVTEKSTSDKHDDR